MNPEEMLTHATAELESAEAELHAAQQRVNELRMIQEGVRLAMQRYGQVRPSVSVPAPEVEPQNSVVTVRGAAGPTRRPRRRSVHRPKPAGPNQSDLCMEALREFGRPASASEVRERLRQRGHNFDPEQIRGAFAYLLKKERVVRHEVGVWALPPSQPATALNGSSSSDSVGSTY